jgi:hypothetical protein
MMKLFNVLMANLVAILVVAIVNPSSAEKTSDRYRSSGIRGNLFATGGGCNEEDPFFSNYINFIGVDAYESTQKLDGNGKPTAVASPSLSVYAVIWIECTLESIVYYIISGSDNEPVLDLPSNKNLLRGSATGTVPGSFQGCYLVRKTCTEDGNDFNCDYYECNSNEVTADIAVTWTGTGDIEGDRSRSNDRYTDISSGSFRSVRTSSSGFSRPADATIAFSVNGDPYEFGTSAGYLYKDTISTTTIDTFQN